ncbi:MAG TPA: cysteine--tRNA ligase [Gemmatimonadales bacterium]|jgi:cysteinyl-tRNA synthetase|nr:cysteine--tRNA ligase [Gemmatimonadales bacterium]
MTLRLHNTLTRRIEPFVPYTPGRVSLYTCGPTIYNYAHIGNFRTFLFEDLLRRWLEASGYEVFHIMNLTDVDDRTIAAAVAKGVSLRRQVDPFATAFEEDRDWLRIRPPHAQPRATEYIGPMIELIEELLQRGVAYRGDDGSVYFAIASFPAYGRLSRLDRRELRAGASERVSADEYAKEDARDFVLWKAAKPEDEAVGAAWDAPFGRGRPGWHIECSAMALELIRRKWGVDVLDIHAGAVDLIFPHHEDEIAQSCAYTGKEEFARVWVHGEFLDLEGTKMSKRYGNILTARDLREQGADPGAVRHLLFSTHYRQKLDWSDAALAAAGEGSARLGAFRDRLELAATDGDDPEAAAAAERFRQAFTAALNEDINAPEALAALHVLVREGNRLLDEGRRLGPAFRGAWAMADDVLAVAPAAQARTVRADALVVAEEDGIPVRPPEVPPPDPADAEAWALRWAAVRAAEKRARNFGEADRIRDLLRAAGWEIRDRRDGAIEVVRRTPPAH